MSLDTQPNRIQDDLESKFHKASLSNLQNIPFFSLQQVHHGTVLRSAPTLHSDQYHFDFIPCCSLTHSASATLSFFLEYARNAPSQLWPFALVLCSIQNALPIDTPLIITHLLQISAQTQAQEGLRWLPHNTTVCPAFSPVEHRYPTLCLLFHNTYHSLRHGFFCHVQCFFFFYVSFHKDIRSTMVGAFVLFNDILSTQNSIWHIISTNNYLLHE